MAPQQHITHFTSLCHTLERKPDKSHFLALMQTILGQDPAELVPPLHDEDECWYLSSFGMNHPRKPDQIRVVFESSASHQGVSLNNVLLTGPDLNNSLLGVLISAD